MQEDVFSSYNPITNFIFFMGAIIMTMFFMHPVFALCSLICALVFYFTLKRTKGFKSLKFSIPLLVILTVINPLFNTQGKHIIFRIFGRPYTIEALLYGFTLALVVVAVFYWFGCFNVVLTSDKFIYLFGRITPSISLILSMIFRLIPDFQRKTTQLYNARASIGMAGDSSSSKKEKIRNGAVILGTLTSWALENGIMAADSMRSRGYGSGRRTSFAIYKFDVRNIILILAFVIFGGLTIVCAAMGGTEAEFTPTLNIAWFGNIWTITGIIVYAVYLILPTLLNVKEAITWHVLRSRI